jgi:hypothetical protein
MAVCAPRRVCATPGCPNRVVRGSCEQCQRQQRQQHRRPSAHAQGYTARWQYFRAVTFPGLLLERDKVPACGARLADGPSPYSRCARDGFLEVRRLHLDHEPPLEEWERSLEERVCDPARVAFLCHPCHTAKTNEQRLK